MTVPRPRSAGSPDAIAALGPVRLRRKRPGDVADDYAWRTDPEIARFDGRPPLRMSYPEFSAQAEREMLFGSASRGSFSIEDAEGRHIGNIMYYNAAEGRESAEIGMVIGAEPDRGRGHGRAAVVAFVRYLWSEQPFRHLYLHTLEWNERARRCFRDAGFDETARVLRDGQAFIRMEVRREWWLLWEAEGRFDATPVAPVERTEGGEQPGAAAPRRARR